MNAMEMSALVISPVPKLPKAKKPKKGPGEKEKEKSEKKSTITRGPSATLASGNKITKLKKLSSIASAKTAKGSKKSLHPSELHGFQLNDASQSKDTGSGMLESEISQGFLTSNDIAPGSGDSASGSAQ